MGPHASVLRVCGAEDTEDMQSWQHGAAGQVHVFFVPARRLFFTPPPPIHTHTHSPWQRCFCLTRSSASGCLPPPPPSPPPRPHPSLGRRGGWQHPRAVLAPTSGGHKGRQQQRGVRGSRAGGWRHPRQVCVGGGGGGALLTCCLLAFGLHPCTPSPGDCLHGDCLHGGCLHGDCLHGDCLHGDCLHGGCLHGGCLHACTPPQLPLPTYLVARPSPTRNRRTAAVIIPATLARPPARPQAAPLWRCRGGLTAPAACSSGSHQRSPSPSPPCPRTPPAAAAPPPHPQAGGGAGRRGAAVWATQPTQSWNSIRRSIQSQSRWQRSPSQVGGRVGGVGGRVGGVGGA